MEGWPVIGMANRVADGMANEMAIWVGGGQWGGRWPMGWEVANGVGGGQWDGGWRATIKAESTRAK